MTGSVVTSSETYHFEPSEYFIKKPHPHHMIAYRASDVKRKINRSKFDHVVVPPLPPEEQTKTNDRPTSTNADHSGISTGTHQTVKRQAIGDIGGSSCPVYLVSDFRFFKEFGLGDFNESVAGITRRLVSELVSGSECNLLPYLSLPSILSPFPLFPSPSLSPLSLSPPSDNSSFPSGLHDLPRHSLDSGPC